MIQGGLLFSISSQRTRKTEKIAVMNVVSNYCKVDLLYMKMNLTAAPSSKLWLQLSISKALRDTVKKSDHAVVKSGLDEMPHFM